MNGDVRKDIGLNMAELLDFPGKEMSEIIIGGRRTPPRPIRIAVGIGGVYTLEIDADKVLRHWTFTDIKDYNYTGYSFTLTLHGNTNFHVRTNDGRDLSSWIDKFSKNPEKAVVEARRSKSQSTNSTTMRRYGTDFKPAYHQPKYYTLDTRKSRSGSSKSRALFAYGVDQKSLESSQISSLPRADPPAQPYTHRWSTGGTTPTKAETSNRNCTRCSSVDVLENSGEFGRGREQRAKSVDCEIDSTGKKHVSDSHPELSTNEVRQEEGPSPKVISSPVSNLLKGVTTGTSGKTYPTEVVPNRVIPPPRVVAHGSTLPTEKESSDECLPIVPPRTKKDKRRTSSSSSSQVDDNDDPIMIKISDQELDRRALLNPPKHKPHAYEAIEISSGKEKQQKAKESLQQTYNHLLTEKEDTSGDYDHLIPGKKVHKGAIRHKDGKLGKNSKTEPVSEPTEVELVSEDSNYHLSPPGGSRGVRRNESLPPMRARSFTGESITSTADEQSGSSDTEEVLTELSPCMGAPSVVEGVVRRRQPKQSEEHDPFADLFFASSSKSRLRWSQELNPLYDYIRGGKVSPAVGYDSTLAPTPENAVLEDVHPPEVDENGSLGSECSGDGQIYDSLILSSQSAPNTLQRPVNRRMHHYDEVAIKEDEEEEDIRTNSKGSRPMSEHYHSTGKLPSVSTCQKVELDSKSATMASPLKRVKTVDASRAAISPRLGKRPVHRRSKTVRSSDDSNAPQRTQRAQRVANTMKDFSYIAREYRVFYIKLPNGQLVTEVVNINRPVSLLIEKLMDLLGSGGCDPDNFSIYVEGAVLTTVKEATLEFGEITSVKPHAPERSTSSSSLMQLVDSNSLPDQGPSPLILKSSLSLRMQGITTTRILRLDDLEEEHAIYPKEISTGFDFHKNWLGIVQGNQPVTLDDAVKLAALQYQAYFLERTAENSVIGFCRPTEFVPSEYANVRSIEQRMYKEQERLKSKSHSDIQRQYTELCSSLPTSNTIYFPVREARKRLLQSARLRPVLFGVSKSGISRVCPKTKEVLDSWDYQVLKNWAYSRRTFVLAFNNKNYPIESNQAKWISELVDFFVEALVGTGSVGSPA